MARNKNKTKRPPNPPPKEKETIESTDDEEISEDEAFNSEDERQYGDFFSKNDDDSASDSSFDDDDDDDDDEGEEDDGGEYMLSLLDNIDKSNNNENPSSAANSSHLPESEHNVSSSSHNSQDKNLTIQSLLSGITSTKGFTPLQKRMHSLHKETTSSTSPSTTSAPLSRPAANRQRQQLHHTAQSTELTRYSTTVATNRRAETLDFRSTPHPTPTTRDLVGKFSPTTPFELEMAALLESKGQSNDGDENEALLLASSSDKLTPEELQKRHGAMAKMRALLFYDERKRHLAKKIKSKTYRRIQRKKRQRDADGDENDDPERAAATKEKEELERMKERLTLAHRNTSKWAKRQLRRGKHMDVDARRALSAQVKKGEDLRRKVEGESSSDEEEDMLREMTGLFGKGREEEEVTGVFKMGFMKRAMERQKEKAKEEAKALLLELEAQEEDMEGGGDETEEPDDDGGDDDGKKKKKTKKAKIAKRDVLPKGEMMASQLKHGNSSSLSVSGGIAIDLDGDDDDDDEGESCHDGDNQKDMVETEQNDEEEEEDSGDESESKETMATGTKAKKGTTNDAPSKEKKRKARKNKDDDDDDDDDDELANFNGWMKDTNEKKKQEDKKLAKTKRKREARDAAKTKNQSNSATATHSEHSSEITLSKQHDDHDTLSQPSPATTATKGSSKETTASNEANPWMTAPSRKRSKKQRTNDVVDITAAASQLHNDNNDKNTPSNTNNAPQSSPSSPPPSSKTPKPTIQLTQDELVSRAFATPADEALDEFAEEKKEVEEGGNNNDKTKKNKKDAPSNGWGSWAGKGVPPPPPPKKTKPSKNQEPTKPTIKTPTHPPNVILNPSRIASHSRYRLGNVPYPYASKREYELAMKGGIGPEWNVTAAINDKVMPRVLRTDGKIIKPLGRRSKSKKRDAARKSKF